MVGFELWSSMLVRYMCLILNLKDYKALAVPSSMKSSTVDALRLSLELGPADFALGVCCSRVVEIERL